MRKTFVGLLILLLVASLSLGATKATKRALDGWTTSFSIYLVPDTLWGNSSSAAPPTPDDAGTYHVDYEGYPAYESGGDAAVADSTDSTLFGLYVKVWAMKISNSDPTQIDSVQDASGNWHVYSKTYYTVYGIGVTGTPFQVNASDFYPAGYHHYLNIQFSLNNIKNPDGSEFGFDNNDSLFVYIEDRYGNYSCYPDSGSECRLMKFAWADYPGASWPADPSDSFGMYNPGIIDSLTWGRPDFWDKIYPANPCSLLDSTAVHEKPAVPQTPTLVGNKPNPFNSATDIEFILPEADHVKLEVTDVLGKRVKLLCDKEMSEGTHKIRWDGTDDKGKEVPSGVYFYKLTVGKNFVDKKKMTLIK